MDQWSEIQSGLVTPWIHDVRLSRFGLLKAVNGGPSIQREEVVAICATFVPGVLKCGGRWFMAHGTPKQ